MPRKVAIPGFVLLCVIVLAVLFQWNWLRGPLASLLSARLHRPVRIAGNLEVHPWTGSPWARINGIIVGEERAGPIRPTAGVGVETARIPSLAVHWRWWSLLSGRIALPLIEARGPSVDLLAGEATGGPPKRPGNLPRIDHLIISGGAFSYRDPAHRIVFTGTLATDERHAPAAPGLTTVHGRLRVGAAAWAGPALVLDAPRLTVQVRLLPLMDGSLQLPLVEVDGPRAHLVRDASGRGNWEIGAKNAKLPKIPTINRLIVKDGVLDYTDARAKLAFAGTVSTTETVQGYGQGAFGLRGQGRLNQAPFAIRLSGGPLINIDPNRPYPFDADVTAGATHISARGSVAHPFHFDAVSGVARVRGADLSNLFVLTRVALPSTPPYDLSAGFARRGRVFALRNLVGRMGESDLAGSISVDTSSGRPFLRGDLTSRRLRLSDLSAVIGGVPKHARGQLLSPTQQVTAARLAAEHRFLPDTHLQVDRVRTTDAAVTYRAVRVDAGRLPVRSLFLNVCLSHGRLAVDPLTMTLPQGNIAAAIHLDARGAVPAESFDAKLSNGRLENLLPAGPRGAPIEGSIFARLRLSGRGDSVRAAAASANGTVSVAIPGGQIRQAFAELLGIDATKGLFLLLTKSEAQTPIRCAVADFQATNGILTARRIVFDTGVVLATGAGSIDLRDETLRLRITGTPKKFRLVRIGAPITVTGPLISPHFGVDIVKAAPQVLASAALGAVVAPLSALLAFINPGLAKNADCAALMAGVR